MGRPRAWTDDDLIAAVAASTTLTEVLECLGLSKGGGSLTLVRRRMLALGLDTPQILRQARSEKWMAEPDDDVAHAPTSGRWTEAELRMAVVASTSMRGVMDYLGYGAGGGAWSTAKAQILDLGLDTSHFSGHRVKRYEPLPRLVGAQRRTRSWTDADLREAVAVSQSIAGVIRHMNLKVGGSVYVVIKERIAALRLDTSHFNGKAWSRGRSVTCWAGRPLDEILVEDSDYHTTSSLRKRLLKEGLKEARCEGCGGTEWMGQPIPLQLDHINGDRRDNRLENLRLLCPNCHSQTETWCGKNRGRYAGGPGVRDGRADMHLSNRCAERREGSNPSGPTEQLTFGDLDALD